MSSSQRNSSAVRNLRSLFENKSSLDSNSPDSRGRSPSGLSSDKEEGQRRTSKVRASFVPVGPANNMAAAVDGTGRRGSFGEGEGDLLELKKTVSEQQDTMDVPEAAIESAAVTPMRRPGEGQLGHDDSPLANKADQEPENPDKPVTGAEEEPGEMKTADPANEDAVSGGDALPPVAEDLRSPTKKTPSKAQKTSGPKKPTTSGKPAAISTKAATKPSSSFVKSPASQPKTPRSAKASSSVESPNLSTHKEPSKKASRSSLTAPTAASMARSGAGSDRSTSSKTSPPTKSKAREVTKPVSLSSHLTAPTAASKAKHDPTPAPTTTTSTLRTSTASRPKPQTSSAKPAPRSSFPLQQRPKSRESEASTRRSMAPASGSFLDRMTKPTASSTSKTHEKVTHEKVEKKSPARSKATAPKPKVNGHVPKPTTQVVSNPAPVDEPHTVHEQPVEATGLTFAAGAATSDDAIGVPEDIGNETPIPHTNGEADAALEATPAGLGGEELIR